MKNYKNIRNNQINVGGIPLEPGETVMAEQTLKEIKVLVKQKYLEEVKDD